MDNSVINTLPGEAEDLALHVKLCEQRYLQLISKLDNQDEQLAQITATLDDIKGNFVEEHYNTLKNYLKWSGVIITTLVGVVIHYMLK